MGIQKMKLVTGTMLTLMMSAVVVAPVLARPVSQQEPEVLISQQRTSRVVQGKIREISGDMVTLDTQDGVTERFSMSRSEIQRLNLQPESMIRVLLDNQNMARDVSLVQGSLATTNNTDRTSTMNSTDRTTTMDNADRTTTMDNADRTTTMDNTDRTTIRRQSEVIERRTVQRVDSPVENNQDTAPTQVEEQNTDTPTNSRNTQARPVRALW